MRSGWRKAVPEMHASSEKQKRQRHGRRQPETRLSLRSAEGGPAVVAGAAAMLRGGLVCLLLAQVACTPSPVAPEVSSAPVATNARTAKPSPAPVVQAESAVATAAEIKPQAAIGSAEDPQQLPVWDEQTSRREIALDHVGKVAIGARMADLKQWASWNAGGQIEAYGGACEYYDGSGLPQAISMMTDDAVVVRFDLWEKVPECEFDGTCAPGSVKREPGVQFGPFGLRTGISRAEALSKLPGEPQSELRRDFVVDVPEDDEYLTWLQPGTDLGIRLEISRGQVSGMYWGRRAAIELVEGCH